MLQFVSLPIACPSIRTKISVQKTWITHLYNTFIIKWSGGEAMVSNPQYINRIDEVVSITMEVRYQPGEIFVRCLMTPMFRKDIIKIVLGLNLIKGAIHQFMKTK